MPEPTTTYSALAVANFIILCAKEPVTNLKLQKMLYFAQGYFLGKLGHPLFHDSIHAWTYGPVVPSVYRCFAKYRDQPISSISPSEAIRDEKIKDVLSTLVKKMDGYTASRLVSMTHVQGTPWHRVWNGGYGWLKEIPQNLIAEYFKS